MIMKNEYKNGVEDNGTISYINSQLDLTSWNLRNNILLILSHYLSIKCNFKIWPMCSFKEKRLPETVIDDKLSQVKFSAELLSLKLSSMSRAGLESLRRIVHRCGFIDMARAIWMAMLSSWGVVSSPWGSAQC
ncbi:hypothetical protein TNIN_332891 [Trichonephila inaurata madagascariensis]|uniref:Uncharacterized protein n=1 Tax=Trichonephila inaurata madagascariensis TaxID=2747483 RepID=A0A8X6IMF3_9ARAC|nr:hypothetical protein TNIN_332891 [Trichonephila inaurata madagascariensis]